MSAARKAGLEVTLLSVESSMEGGYRGGLSIAGTEPRPDCLFCASDSLAIGVLRAMREKSIKTPEDIELISIGNGDREMEEYASVPLSVIHLPMEDMAGACFKLAMDLLRQEISPPHSIRLPLAYHRRESCGE
jgi:DNA-binding LacI/PurR family transcriptional regulator